VRRSKTLLLGISFVTPWRVWCLSLQVPRPRTGNATRLYHRLGLGSSRFARRYSGSRCCFLFLRVLRCFNSPGSLYRPYVFRPEYCPQEAVGFPIRISTDRSLVGSSPWLFAATHVLHRLQAPRHPPLALCSLENKDARARYGVLKGRRPDKGSKQRAAGPEGRHRTSSAPSRDAIAAPPENGTEVARLIKVRNREKYIYHRDRSSRSRVASDQLGVLGYKQLRVRNSLERR
jgi:hypothetical protein